MDELTIDPNLCVILKTTPERLYILPSPPTHAGRFSVLSKATREIFRASLSEIAVTSPEAKYWMSGYVAGSSPRAPSNFSGSHLAPNHPLIRYFSNQLKGYWETGDGIRPVGYHSPNCYNTLLQYLLKSGQAKPAEVSRWAKDLNEDDIPKHMRLDDRIDLLKWVRLLEGADCMSAEELVRQLRHPGDEVDALTAFKLYVSFISYRSLDLFSRVNLNLAVQFFFKDDFWAEEAKEVTGLLSNFPRQNKEQLENGNYCEYSDPNLAMAFFPNLGRAFDMENPSDSHLNPAP